MLASAAPWGGWWVVRQVSGFIFLGLLFWAAAKRVQQPCVVERAAGGRMEGGRGRGGRFYFHYARARGRRRGGGGGRNKGTGAPSLTLSRFLSFRTYIIVACRFMSFHVRLDL